MDRVGRAIATARQAVPIDAAIPPVVLLSVCIFLAVGTSSFTSSANISNVLVQASVLALVSFGLTSLLLLGELDLSVGSGVALASVVSAHVMKDSNSVVLGVLAGVACGAAIGAVNGVVVTLLRVPSFIATLGMLEVARGIALALTNGEVVYGLPPGLAQLANGRLLGLEWPVWIAAAGFVVLYLLLKRTTFGVRVMSIGGNREAARLSSVPVEWVRLAAFVITGICVGVAGVIVTARVQSGQPNTSSELALFAIAAVVVGGTSMFGGRGSISRTLWGVLLISVVQNGLDLKGVNDDLKQVVIGIVFIVAASGDFVRGRLRRSRAPQQVSELPAINEAPLVR
jgi:ribose transport system permease protein